MEVVGYQGVAGAYSEAACRAVFLDGDFLPYASIGQVFHAVEAGEVQHGLVPLENCQAGSINETYDLLLEHPLCLVGECVIFVDHCLVALPDVALGELDEVISHPQALAQCATYLSSLPVTVRADTDTAGAARRIVQEGLRNTGAVASERAARLYGLRVLASHIQTHPENATRFGVIARESDPLRRPDKTSLVFGTGHVPGALHRCIGAFASRELNLTKLESRPRAGHAWEYVFYVDVDSARDTHEMIEALAELGEHALFTRVLGSYASWSEDGAPRGAGRGSAEAGSSRSDRSG